MKKTILVSLIAVAMLFAFTACEQSMPTYRNADYITVSQNTPIIKGEDFSASDFDVTVHYTDGSTSVVNGNGIVKDTDWTNGAVTASINTNLTANYTVEFVELVDCEISIALADDAEFTTSIKPTATANEVRYLTEDVESITYTYETATYEVSDVSKYTAVVAVDYDMLTTAGTYDVTANVYSDYTSASSVGTKIGEVATSVTVTPAPATTPTVTDVNLLYTVTRNGNAIATDVTTLPALYMGDKVDISLKTVATMNGEDASSSITSGNITLQSSTITKSFSEGVLSLDVTGTAQSGTVYVNIDGTTYAKPIANIVGANTVVKEDTTTNKLTVVPVSNPQVYVGTVLSASQDITSLVQFTTGFGLVDKDGVSTTNPSYTVTVDPQISYTLVAGSNTIWARVNYNSYGEPVSEFVTITFSNVTARV